jgi:phosphatidylserine decarboxylase
MNFITYAPEAWAIPVIIASLAVYLKYYRVAMVATALLLIVTLFYRGWQRPLDFAPPEHIVSSPCDGKIIGIRRVGRYTHVAVFLNLHNIHVQYAPVKGVITSITHHKGTFVPAYLFVKSMYNERTETGFRTPYGTLFMTQIAGQLARRIVSFKKPGEQVSAGEPVGLIKLGSRVDLWIPGPFKIDPKWTTGSRIHIGDKIGEYIYARLL